MLVLEFLDVVLVLAAAAVLLPIGTPAVGYAAGAGVWIALRAMGVAVDWFGPRVGANREISLRLAYLITRILLLALTVVLVRRGAGRDDGLTALLVIVFAFTVQLVLSFATRPRGGASPTARRP